jgi:hypothetical protein
MKKKFIDRKNKMIAQKNQFVKEVAQSLADSLVLSMGMVVSKSQKETVIFYSLLLNNYMIDTHDVYLD